MNCTFEMVNELHIYSIFWIVCRMIIRGRMDREIFMYIKKILSKIIFQDLSSFNSLDNVNTFEQIL